MNKILSLIALLMMYCSAMGQTKNFIDQPYIETTAKVDTLVIPDRIYLSILVSESDTKGRQTVEELEKAMINKLTMMGIDLKKQLFLSDLSSNFKKYFLRKKDILKAKSYELKVYDAKTAGRVIYEMEGIGISNIDLQRTEYSKIEELKLELKSKAMRKAKQQADTLVKPLNQSVGNAIYISDMQNMGMRSSSGAVNGIVIRGYSSQNKKYEEAPPIEFQKIKVESQIEVKFAIKGK